MKKILPFSFYLFYFGANACFIPYIVLYYQSLNLSGTQIGLLFAISPLITLIAAPFWTGIADTMHRHKLVMSVSILSVIGIALLYPQVKTFLAVLTLASLFSFMVAPIGALADTATMTMLGDQRNMYGRIRIGGTIGWGVIAPIAGMLIASRGLFWAFWSYAALMFIGFLLSRGFVFERVQEQVSLRHGLRELMSNKHMALFFSTSFVTGIAFASINSYFAAYINELGFDNSLLGMALGIATISELPVLFFGNLLLAKIKPRGLLILSMLATSTRLFLYAIFNTAAGILIFQLINGLTFGALWLGGVSYVNENAPKGLSATAQGLFGAMVFGFGSAAGGFLSAILFERLGGGGMYAVFGAMLMLALIVYVWLERRLG
jgi:PPP family 3-phenylpropionic acid transporter